MNARPNKTLLMAILNLTPDSFSGDGVLPAEAAGQKANVETAGTGRSATLAAVARANQLVEDGADIIDLGAESTRPNAQALTPDAEWQRLQPVLQALSAAPWRTGAQARVQLSVDTRYGLTAQRALQAGVDIVNDVSGLADPAMAPALRATHGDVVVMHALTVPVDPAVTLPAGCDVVAELLQWKTSVTRQAVTQGIAAERLVYDPGLGFGKNALQSLQLVLRAPELLASGGRWLVGHSRKSYQRLFTSAEAADRDDLTLAFSAGLVHAGVQVLRVHNVRRHRELLQRLAA